MSFDELIARLGAATEGSPELDEAIYLATSREASAEQQIANMRHALGREPSDAAKAMFRNAPPNARRYTTSIDVAMSLVPEGWAIHIFTPPLYGRKQPDASLYPPGKEWHDDRSLICEGQAATLPLALCIACLKGARRRRAAATDAGVGMTDNEAAPERTS